MSAAQDSVGPGKIVRIHYVLRGSTGSVIDSSEESEPLEYLHGARNIVPGLEAGLVGATVGQKLRVKVPPEQGYGVRQPGAVHAFPRSSFPEELELEPGMQFGAENDGGEVVTVWIAGVEADRVMVDLNHPLAGETLDFEVTIAGLRAATAEELEHGHPHGPGGHHHH